MICDQCNAHIQDDALFCPKCGTPIKQKPLYHPDPYRNGDQAHADSASYDSEPYRNATYGSSPYGDAYRQSNDLHSGNYGYGEEPDYDDYEEENEPKKSKALVGIVAGLGSLVLILLIVLLAVVLSGKNKKPSDTQMDPAVSASQQAPVDSSASLPAATSAVTPSASAASDTVPVTGTITPGTYKVNTQKDDLNIRSGAGTSFEVIGRIPKDTVVTVSAVNGDWGYVTYGTVSGWVSAQFLAPVIN